MTTFLPQDFQVHSGRLKSGTHLLEANDEAARYFVAIEMPTNPGAPMVGPRGPNPESLDPQNDPMGKMNNVPYGYGDMVDNLTSHYHGANDDEKKQGRLWYRAARDLFHKTAADRNITPGRAVATGAAFSPLTDWGENVKHANQFLMNYHPEDPNHNENDWRMAHIHPAAREAFQNEAGRDPTDSDEDLHHLADLHGGLFARKSADLANPDNRAAWMANIQHHGMDKILRDHEGQKAANKAKPGGYGPVDSMRDSGIKTMGSNISKAKQLHGAPEDPEAFAQILGGPKVRNFSRNILDDTPIDEDGYYTHPNGDWTQHEDLGGTIDSHHLRAASMAHGAWENKGYGAGTKGLDASNPYTYDVFNRGLMDATRRVNAGIEDPTKHITPKQLQAIIWLKHKNDNDRFKPLGVAHEGEITPEILQRAELKRQKARPRAAAIDPQSFAAMPPLWRKMFMSRQSPDWTDLLKDWVDTNAPGPAPSDDQQLERHEDQRMGPQPDGQIEASRWYLPAPTSSWYIDAASDGLDEPSDELKRGRGTGTTSPNPGSSQSAGAAGNITPAGLNKDDGSTSGGALPTYRIPSGGGSGGGGSAMPGSAMPSGGASSSPVPFTPGQGVQQWKNQVELGLQRNGLPVSLENQVMHQMQTESSGDPNAINRTDSNAQAGHPSQGLLQTIPSTFNQYHLPGDSSSITDPQANIDSAIGYAKGRYGPTLMDSQGRGMGSGHGY